jgi:hypothetical protein
MPKNKGVTGRDYQASLSANRLSFLKTKQKEKDSIQSHVINVNHDSNDRITQGRDRIESLETKVQVGAFGVAGIQEGTNDVDELSLPDTGLLMTYSNQDPTSVTITSARVVSDVVTNAIPEEDSLLKLIDNDTPKTGNPKKGLILKYSIIAIASLLLLTGIIISVVILTSKSPNTPPKSAEKQTHPFKNWKIVFRYHP